MKGTIRKLGDVAVTIALGVAAIVVIVRSDAVRSNSAAMPPPVEDVSGERLSTSVPVAASMGKDSAQVVLIEFADFECPFCGRHARETMPKIRELYVDTGKAQYAFRHLPLTKIHANAMSAAKAGHCGGQLGRFWDLHHRMFDEGARLNDHSWILDVSGLKLSPEKFSECFGDPATESAIMADVAEAKRLGVVTTPTFIVGRLGKDGLVRVTTRIRGAQSFDVFKNAMDIATGKS